MAPIVQLLPPVSVRRHIKLGAKLLVGSGIVGVLISRMRVFSRKGDFQLLKKTSSGVVGVKGVKTSEERICGLEVVLERDTASSGGAPNSEIKLVLPPIERLGLPGIPSLIRCRDRAPGEWGILVLVENVLERGIEAISLAVNYFMLVGQRERLFLFEMAARPICR